MAWQNLAEDLAEEFAGLYGTHEADEALERWVVERQAYLRNWSADHRAHEPMLYRLYRVRKKLRATFDGPKAAARLAKYARAWRRTKTRMQWHRKLAALPPPVGAVALSNRHNYKLTPAQRDWARTSDFSPTQAAKILGVSKQAIDAIRRAGRETPAQRAHRLGKMRERVARHRAKKKAGGGHVGQ